MNTQDNKQLSQATTPKTDQKPAPVKQTSGDKAFDDAIDRLLKKPVQLVPAK